MGKSSSREHREHRIIGLVGVRYAGKTQRAKLLFRGATRAIVVDPLAEYKGGFVVSGRSETVSYLCGTERFRVIYRPLEESDFAFACKVAWKAGNCLFIAEELGRYCDTHSIPQEFDDLVTRGRHRGIDVVYTTQRFAMIHMNVRALTDEYYIFRQFEPGDLDHIAHKFGERVAETVRSLDNLEAVHIRVKDFRANDETTFDLVEVVPNHGTFLKETGVKAPVRKEEREYEKVD